MNEETDLRKMAISREAFEKLTENFVERLKREEKIELVVVSAEDLHEIKYRNLGVSGIILTADEKDEYEKELKVQEEIIEYTMPDHIEMLMSALPVMINDEQVHSRHKKNFYVPRVIGRPNAKKKGGR